MTCRNALTRGNAEMPRGDDPPGHFWYDRYSYCRSDRATHSRCHAMISGMR